jgi:hypothetical protein
MLGGWMSRMTPFQKFVRGLQAAQLDFDETMNELISFPEIMAQKQNTLELDEDGFFYVTAAGPIEEVIPVMEKQLEKLYRIRKQKQG